MQFEEITSKFKIKSSGNGTVKAVCPVHGDKHASLSISRSKDGKNTVMYCHAGCDTKSILDSVGLSFDDLFLEHKVNSNNKKNSNIENIYPYVDEQGTLIYEKIRFKGKDFRFKRYVDNKEVWGLSAGTYTETYPGSNNYSPKDRPGAKSITLQEQPKILYNLPKLVNSIKEGYTVYICEGERDVATMQKLGLTATTAPNGGGNGKKKWTDKYSKYFKGASVVIMPDNDKPGQDFANEIQRKIKHYAHATKIITISDQPKGDISDWISEGHNINEFKNIVKETEWNYAPWVVKSKNDNLSINQGLISESIKKTLDYKMIGSPESEKNMLFIYSNGVYKKISKKILNKYVSDYIPVYLRTNNLLNNVTELLLNGDEVYPYSILNGNVNTVNLRNGLYNVNTGELKPHDSNYINSIQLDVNYNKNYVNHGYWDSFLNTLLCEDKDMISIIQEWFGLILSNYDVSIVKKMLLLNGPGNTGKSKVISMLTTLLGDGNSKSVQLQKLGDRFELGNIYKARLIQYGDLPSKIVDDNSTAMLKVLTGGDTLSIELKGVDSFDIEYRGGMMYSCNGMPVITGDLGKHVFERFLILPCCDSIPEDKRDPMIMQKLLKDKEYIFNWSMEGLRRLINNNFKFTYSERIQKSKYEYSLNCDSVQAFISGYYDVTEDKKDRIRLTHLYECYEKYCSEDGLIPVSKKTFKERMNNIGIIFKPYNGYPTYHFIKEKLIGEEVTEQEEKIFDKEVC